MPTTHLLLSISWDCWGEQCTRRNKVSAGGQIDAQRATPEREIGFGIYVAVEPRRGLIGLLSGVITIVFADADVDCSWWDETRSG